MIKGIEITAAMKSAGGRLISDACDMHCGIAQEFAADVFKAMMEAASSARRVSRRGGPKES